MRISLAAPIILGILLVLGTVTAACGGGPVPEDTTPAGAVEERADAVPAAEDEQAVLEIDRGLVAAIRQQDAAALDRLADPEFIWIDPSGAFRPRDSVLASMPRLSLEGAMPDTTVRRYGSSLVVVQHHGGKTHAMHVWVKRPEWRLLHVSEVIEGPRVVYSGTTMGGADCINPCKIVPFVPGNAVERAVIESWQAQQSGPEGWARHIPDDNVARTTNGTYTKADRIAVQQQQIAAGTVSAASPLLWARIWEFDDAALMIALQPRATGKAFLGSRVFELRDGVWMMAESYQTTIENTPPF